MLDVFRERIDEVKEWIHRKVAGGPVEDTPSGRDAAWGVFVAIKILQNILCTNMSVDELTHTNSIKMNKQLVLPVCSNQNIIVLK